MKSMLELLNYIWPIRKTKKGLGIISILILVLWGWLVLPIFSINQSGFILYSLIALILWLIIFFIWLFHSGRMIVFKQPFIAVLCLKTSDAKAAKYVQDSLKILTHELDNLGLLQKIQIRQIGEDVINNEKQAKSYREKFDVGLIIWSEVFSGAKNKENVSEFKNLNFTFKVPPSISQEQVFKFFANDVNIAIINRAGTEGRC